MQKIVVPVDVAVKRYYRVYLETDHEMTDEELKEMARDRIIEEQDDILVTCPDDLEVEESDILFTEIDHDGIWFE